MAKNSVKNIALLQEFERYVSTKYTFKKEGIFNKLMDTKRLFRADYYLPTEKVIVEINGGQWSDGRHTRGGKGYENDLTKLNLASFNGWKVYQFTYEMLQRQEYKNFL